MGDWLHGMGCVIHMELHVPSSYPYGWRHNHDSYTTVTLFNLIAILLSLLRVHLNANGTVHMATVKTLSDYLSNHRISMSAWFLAN